MAELREISDFERSFFKLTKIGQQVDSLSEFLLSKIKEGHDSGPRKKTSSAPGPTCPSVRPKSNQASTLGGN